MIKALEKFDKMAAVGVLARAALSLRYSDSPRSGSVEGEEEIQTRVVEEVRSRLGIPIDDNSSEAVDRMADVLDSEIGSTDCGTGYRSRTLTTSRARRPPFRLV